MKRSSKKITGFEGGYRRINLDYPHLVEILEPQRVSECLRWGVTEWSFLFLLPGTS